MSKTVYQYRIRCTTDNVDEYIWLDSAEPEPTTCPTNVAHSIGAVSITDKVTESEVAIKEEFVPTQGFYQSQGCEADIDANVGSVTVMSHTWPYRVSVLMGWFHGASDNVGDKVQAYVATDTITGAIGAPVAVDDETITVTSTVMDNAAIGFHMKLFDGSNQSDLGRVVAMDTGNSTITVETGSDQIYSPITPTYVQQTVRVIDDMFINVPNVRYVFAEKKVGGKTLPPGIPLEVRYTNRTGGAKKFVYNVEYIY